MTIIYLLLLYWFVYVFISWIVEDM